VCRVRFGRSAELLFQITCWPDHRDGIDAELGGRALRARGGEPDARSPHGRARYLLDRLRADLQHPKERPRSGCRRLPADRAVGHPASFPPPVPRKAADINWIG